MDQRVQSSLDLSAPVAGGNDLSLVELIRVLNHYKYLVLGVTTAATLIAMLAAFLITPIYRAEALLAGAEQTGAGNTLTQMLSQFRGIASMVGGGGFVRARDSRNVAIATLTSPHFIQLFIREKNLLPVLFDGLWDPEAEEWLVDSPEDVPTLSDGQDLFSKEIMTVEYDTLAQVVTLWIDWKDPLLAAEWANQLVEKVNNRLRNRAINESNRMIEYLNKELETTNVVELRQAIYYMIEGQIQARTMANVREEYAFKVINPAIPPDADKFVYPKRMLIIAIGMILGLLFGVFAAFVMYGIKRLQREYATTSEARPTSEAA